MKDDIAKLKSAKVFGSSNEMIALLHDLYSACWFMQKLPEEEYKCFMSACQTLVTALGSKQLYWVTVVATK